MYENFKAYWKAKGAVLTTLGVSEIAAKMIWSDAVDALAYVIEQKLKI